MGGSVFLDVWFLYQQFYAGNLDRELTGLATPFGMVVFQFLLPDHDDVEKAAKS